MKKIELLAPAGNFDMLKMAIHNGADAVYLAGNKFGARKYATNFNNNEIVDAINYAHLYGVKVYVTINTLIYDEEVSEFIDFVEFIHKNNVDAVLMQDIGMINLVKKTFPNLEIHASTQFHNHNIEDLKLLEELGVKRAVLARELTLKEIKELNVNIEKEVFVHGALCVCYSGECLMSSLVMKRSGNRGECAGMCRLPYTLLEDNKIVDTNGNYLLSLKELCTIKNIKDLIESDIDSLKIEGRMKSPEYVGYVTKIYRKAIDSYYNKEEITISEEEYNNLKVLYNREFTTGYINEDKKIINQITPNHIGIEIGEVIDFNDKKIKIKLNRELNQGDAIRFKNSDKGMYVNFIYDNKELLINKGKVNQIVYIDNKVNLQFKDVVNKTIDIKLIENINTYEEKRIPIKINIRAKLNNNLYIEITDGTNIVSECGLLIESSINKSTTKEEITEKISKLGNTVYKMEELNIDLDDNIFIPMKNINELRRNLIEKLNLKRIERKKDFIKKEAIFKIKNPILTNTLNVYIDNEEDYINKKTVNFYTSNYGLYIKYKKNNNIYFRLPRVLKNNINFKNEKLILNDFGYINKLNNENEIISDIYSNITNIYSTEYLHSNGINIIGLSPELDYKKATELYNNYYKKFKYYPNISINIYGKTELMIMKHCILKNNLNTTSYCNNCKNNKKYELLDRNNKKYTLKQNECITTLYNYEILDDSKKLQRKKGLNYNISLIDINQKEKINNIIKEW